jgi:hypothetical protein
MMLPVARPIAAVDAAILANHAICDLLRTLSSLLHACFRIGWLIDPAERGGDSPHVLSGERLFVRRVDGFLEGHGSANEEETAELHAIFDKNAIFVKRIKCGESAANALPGPEGKVLEPGNRLFVPVRSICMGELPVYGFLSKRPHSNLLLCIPLLLSKSL